MMFVSDCTCHLSEDRFIIAQQNREINIHRYRLRSNSTQPFDGYNKRLSTVLFRADIDGFSIPDQRRDVVPDGAGKQIDVADIAHVNPFHADLETVGFGGFFAMLVSQFAEEDEVNLVTVFVVTAFVDAFVNAGHALGDDGVTGFLQKLALYGFLKHFASALTAAGQCVVFAETGTASIYQYLSLVKHNGLGRIADGQGVQSLLCDKVNYIIR